MHVPFSSCAQNAFGVSVHEFRYELLRILLYRVLYMIRPVRLVRPPVVPVTKYIKIWLLSHKCTTSEQDRSLERVCVKRAEERSWPRARDDRWALHFNHGRQGPGEAGGVATRHLKLAVAGPTAVRDAQSHPRRARHRFMPATTGGPPTLLHCDVASRP